MAKIRKKLNDKKVPYTGNRYDRKNLSKPWGNGVDDNAKSVNNRDDKLPQRLTGIKHNNILEDPRAGLYFEKRYSPNWVKPRLEVNNKFKGEVQRRDYTGKPSIVRGSQVAECSPYNFNMLGCNNIPGCYYDKNQKLCVSDGDTKRWGTNPKDRLTKNSIDPLRNRRRSK